jgi:hypothetical protein
MNRPKYLGYHNPQLAKPYPKWESQKKRYEEQNEQDVDAFKQKRSQVTENQCVYL